MRRSTYVAIIMMLALAPLWAAPSKPQRPIKKLKVIVRTADDFGASTDEVVTFSLGPSYTWTLQAPGKIPFRNGAVDVFELAPHGLHAEDIKWIKLSKTAGDDWLCQSLEVWIDGRPYYRNEEINKWFEADKNDWTAPNFPPASK